MSDDAIPNAEIASNIIQILAWLPDFLRKTMLKRRLDDFFNMSKEDKIEIIRNALAAAPTIEFATLSKLIKTWFEALCELDEEKRREIFSVYASLIADSPFVIEKLNIDGLISLFQSLDEGKRALLIDSLKGVINTMNERSNFLAAIPERAKAVLGL